VFQVDANKNRRCAMSSRQRDDWAPLVLSFREIADCFVAGNVRC